MPRTRTAILYELSLSERRRQENFTVLICFPPVSEAPPPLQDSQAVYSAIPFASTKGKSSSKTAVLSAVGTLDQAECCGFVRNFAAPGFAKLGIPPQTS